MSGRDLSRAEVLSRVKRKELKLVEAAEVLGLSYRQAKRLWVRFQGAGPRGLVHGNRGRRSGRAESGEFKRRVLELVRERYGGPVGLRLGPKLASEQLEEEHGIGRGTADAVGWDGRAAGDSDHRGVVAAGQGKD